MALTHTKLLSMKELDLLPAAEKEAVMHLAIAESAQIEQGDEPMEVLDLMALASNVTDEQLDWYLAHMEDDGM